MRPPQRFTSVALLVAALLAPMRPSPAQAADGATAEGPRKLVAYATCAISVFASAAIPAALLAVGACLKAVLEEAGAIG